MPWTLAKEENKDRLKTVLYNLIETVRVLGVLLAPIIPETATKILDEINADERDLESIKTFGGYVAGTKVGEAKPLFNRIDEKAKLEELQAKVEAKKAAYEAEQKAKESNLITMEELDKVELKVAKILTAERVEGANKLYKLTVDLGKEQRTVVSGLVPYYTETELVGKKVVLVSNLKPAKLRGIESNGMLLAAGDGDTVKLITIDGDIEVGEGIH